MIFVEIFHDFGWFFATRIRIRQTKMKRIHTDPDPKHWFKQSGSLLNGLINLLQAMLC